MNSFTYLRRRFTPIGQLPKDATFFTTTRKCRSIGIDNYNGGKYSYSEFYKAAKKAGCGEVDLFEMNGSTIVLPCENELFEYSGKFDFADKN